MSQKVHAVFPCQKGKGAELLEWLRANLPETRAFPGCEAIEAYSNGDDPDQIILWETFAERADHEAYVAWRIETGFLDILPRYLAGELQISYLDIHTDV